MRNALARHCPTNEEKRRFMPSPETLSAFFVTAVIMALAPGPDNLFVLTQSALYGARAGLATTLGLATGLFVHTAAVALGVAALFQTSEAAFTGLKLAGAAYLLYLAWLSFRSGASKASLEGSHFPGNFALYRRGVIMNITNPKVTLFFLAFLPQFADPARGSLPLQIVIFGVLFQIATLLVFGAVAALGGRLALWFNTSVRGQLLLNRAAGCIFVGLALALLFAGR